MATSCAGEARDTPVDAGVESATAVSHPDSGTLDADVDAPPNIDGFIGWLFASSYWVVFRAK